MGSSEYQQQAATTPCNETTDWWWSEVGWSSLCPPSKKSAPKAKNKDSKFPFSKIQKEKTPTLMIILAMPKSCHEHSDVMSHDAIGICLLSTSFEHSLSATIWLNNTMSPTTSLAAVAVASLVRGGARKAPPPPPPDKAIMDKFMKLNEPLRFFISGNIGNVIFFYIERVTFYLLNKMNGLPPVVQEYIDSVSFFIAYLLQVIPQHWLHAYLVYGLDTIDTRQKYFTTLFGCYSA